MRGKLALLLMLLACSPAPSQPPPPPAPPPPPSPLVLASRSTALRLTGILPGTLEVSCEFVLSRAAYVQITVDGVFRPDPSADLTRAFDAPAGATTATFPVSLTFETWPHSLGFVAGAPRDAEVVSPPWLRVSCRVESEGQIVQTDPADLHLLGDGAWSTGIDGFQPPLPVGEWP